LLAGKRSSRRRGIKRLAARITRFHRGCATKGSRQAVRLKNDSKSESAGLQSGDTGLPFGRATAPPAASGFVREVRRELLKYNWVNEKTRHCPQKHPIRQALSSALIALGKQVKILGTCVPNKFDSRHADISCRIFRAARGFSSVERGHSLLHYIVPALLPSFFLLFFIMPAPRARRFVHTNN
jgi:hypothetical protein